MKKFSVLPVLAVLLLYGATVSAQTYTYTSGLPGQGGCTSLSRDLSIGSRGTDVTTLQNFLVSQNYPGGGNWMVTGYFGAATAQAVRNFQGQQGLAVTGSLDASTRAVISRVTCGTSGQASAYPYLYNYNNYSSTIPYSSIDTNSYNYNTYPYQCGTYGNYGSCGCNGYTYSLYNYNNCSTNLPPNNLNTPTIIYLSPSSGIVGTSVTVYGSGFSTQGNTVHFGTGIISNLMSPDGHSVSFIVPTQLTGFGSQVMTLSTYNVSVTNSAGYTSNTMPFAVTGLASSGAPSIVSVSGPTTLTTNSIGVWTIGVNSQGNLYTTLSVHWGDENIYGAALTAQQMLYTQGLQTFTFSHAYMQTGTYTITFTASNNNGQQNVSSATVVVSGSSSGQVTLSSLSPTSGHVGSQIMLQGSGFTALDNTIHFGIGGTQHLGSQNGSTIYYTVPAFVSPCDVATSGTLCAQNVQQVMPGLMQIYVTNSNGTTNVLYFTVI